MTYFRRSPAALLLVAALFAPNVQLIAQVPTASASRNVQSQIERDEARVKAIINAAERLWYEGTLHLKDNQRLQARDKFDKSVDVVLESGMDVRGNPRLQQYYSELVERIYRLEVGAGQPQPSLVAQVAQTLAPAQDGRTIVTATPAQDGKLNPPPPQVGFREQKFEPSPLDDLSKLKLTTAEEQVTTEELVELEETKLSLGFKFNTHALVQQYINYYQGRGRSTMESGLRRSGRFMRLAKRIFREEGVPEDIAWLGQVESAWRPTARSWAAASGLWQFIPSTGSRFGLRQTAWVDERNSFEKATRASARYLKWLNNRYNGNWELAMGAYNTGEGNIDRAIRRAGRPDFWATYPFIAQETRNYVPNILATILIAKNPAKYGFHNIKPEAPLSYDEVRVPSATSLQLIANLTGSSLDYLRSINPELRRDVTPRGEAYVVRVPAGRATQFVAGLRGVPAGLRDGGGVQLASKSYVRAGQTAPTGSSLKKVRAKAGETIASIAARYGVAADEVARLNGIAANIALTANQEITVPSQGAGSAPARPTRRR
ncbi:MAG: transglycosylase SLT domain-containing protein [Pyrinomonadaceae bacterium MAG19_C2-C3]|nr:transglycosylase SLT domain-containing protein [Pyrinomonadaceae bacterium MAG19_C2-C3]